MKYTADFETTTISPARVWLWGICNIDNVNIWYKGETIEQFFQCVKALNNPTLYFHNLKFDGNFIIYYLIKQGFNWVEDKRDAENKTFTTLITGDGLFYSITIYFEKSGHHVKKCEILDSLKILNMPVAAIAKSFKLPILKGSIDYAAHNHGEPPTANDIAYLKNDVQIPALALHEMFEAGFTKMTMAGNSFNNYKEFIGKKKFEKYFPQLTLESDKKIRSAYKGGFTFANPDHAGKDINDIIIGLDVNSLYPYVMSAKPLPYGVPVEFSGQYPENKRYPLYVQHMRCMFELKPGHIPTIQLKHSRFFNGTEYLESSRNKATGNHELIEITLTSVDLELFFKHYNIFNIEYLGGYMFQQSTELFREWVEHWTAEKIKAGKEHNAGKRQIAKRIMNSLYGRFALNPATTSKYPVLDVQKDIVKYKLVKYEVCDEKGNQLYNDNNEPLFTTIKYRDPVYIPVGVFITAWARFITISTSQQIHENSLKETGVSRYLYSDTDSIYLIGDTVPDGVHVDAFALGAWKLETKSERGRFIQAKRYIIDVIDYYGDDLIKPIKNSYGDLITHFKITCAGMPEQCKHSVTWDNFKNGYSFDGKLKPEIVPGGVILVDIPFTMK